LRRPILGLGVTIRAQDLQRLEPVVERIAVDVVKL